MIVTSLVVAQVKGKWDVGLQFRSKNCTTEIPKLGKGPVDQKVGPRVQITLK